MPHLQNIAQFDALWNRCPSARARFQRAGHGHAAKALGRQGPPSAHLAFLPSAEPNGVSHILTLNHLHDKPAFNGSVFSIVQVPLASTSAVRPSLPLVTVNMLRQPPNSARPSAGRICLQHVRRMFAKKLFGESVSLIRECGRQVRAT